MIYELNHIGIKTADIEASIGFYHHLLGGTIVRDAKSLDGLSRFVYIQLGMGIVELITVNDYQDQGYAHVAYLVDSTGLDKSYEMLIEKGFEFTVRPKVAGSGDGRLAFFRDPCGVINELIEREPRPRADATPNAKILSFDHTLLGTGMQLESCKTFYSTLMDMTACEGNRVCKGSDALELSAEEGGIVHISLKTASCASLREELRRSGVATRDAEGGFIAVAPSGELVYLFE